MIPQSADDNDFTPNVIMLMDMAGRIAIGLNRETLDCGHIVMAMKSLPADSSALRILRTLGLENVGELMTEIQALDCLQGDECQRQSSPSPCQLKLSIKLQMALEHAKSLTANHLGVKIHTASILFGVMSASDYICAVFSKYGISMSVFRSAVYGYLTGESPNIPPEPPDVPHNLGLLIESASKLPEELLQIIYLPILDFIFSSILLCGYKGSANRHSANADEFFAKPEVINLIKQLFGLAWEKEQVLLLIKTIGTDQILLQLVRHIYQDSVEGSEAEKNSGAVIEHVTRQPVVRPGPGKRYLAGFGIELPPPSPAYPGQVYPPDGMGG